MLDCKTEKRNSQSEHGQPTAQTKGFICMCDSGVADCQSQHQCHFGRIRSGLHGQLSLAAVNQMYVFHVFQDSLKACFENVNINIYIPHQGRSPHFWYNRLKTMHYYSDDIERLLKMFR